MATRHTRKAAKAAGRVGGRVGRYAARSAWKGTRAATTWTARHGTRAVARGARGAVAPASGLVRTWSQDRAAFGWQPVFACDCGERVPAHLQAAHLATHEARPAPRPAVPSGEQVLARERPRTVWAHIEVIRPEDVAEARREPGRREIACRCGEWVGRRSRYPRHAQQCEAVAELRELRHRENQAWLQVHRPELADEIEAAPAAAALPDARPGARKEPSTEVAVMQEPKGWAGGSAVLAEPAIDQEHFKEEVPAFLEQVVEGFNPLVEHFSALSEYLTAASFDESGQTQARIDETVQALIAAQDSMRGSHAAAVEYIESIQMPDFSRV